MRFVVPFSISAQVLADNVQLSAIGFQLLLGKDSCSRKIKSYPSSVKVGYNVRWGDVKIHNKGE